MSREAKLRRKNGYWYTEAGGGDTYFGRIDLVPFRDARKLFRAHLKELADERRATPLRSVTALDLCNRHLDWCQVNRSEALFHSRKSILTYWCNHVVDDRGLYGSGTAIGEHPADKLGRRHLEEHLRHRGIVPSSLTGKPLGEKSLRHIVVAVKATWNWAADTEECGGGELLPEGFRPFGRVPRPYVSPRNLTEEDLVTDVEVQNLFKWADIDTDLIRGENGRYRSRQPSERRRGKQNPYQVYGDILRLFYATGSRPGEVCSLCVRDLLRQTRQLVLGRHKRSKTERHPTLRTIQLGDEAYAIVRRHCLKKNPDAPIFTQHDGRRWTTDWLDRRFKAIRSLAGVRDHVVLYSFRHLYISELLMAGVQPFDVAKMAGTSLQEIERTYGHFSNRQLAEAQAKLDEARAGRRSRTN